jgi:hypothetical protein
LVLLAGISAPGFLSANGLASLHDGFFVRGRCQDSTALGSDYRQPCRFPSHRAGDATEIHADLRNEIAAFSL